MSSVGGTRVAFGYKSGECINMIKILLFLLSDNDFIFHCRKLCGRSRGIKWNRIDWILTDLANIELGRLKWMYN